MTIPNRKDMTPHIGTAVRGAQLSQFTAQQNDELALYVAERGVVVFRNQDFVDQGAEWLKEYVSYFGRLYAHLVGPHATVTAIKVLTSILRAKML